MPLLRRFCLVLLLLITAHAVALESVPKAEYHARRVKLAESLKGGSVLIFGNSEPAEEYLQWRQSDDFYYLTGWNEPGAALLIVPAREAFVSKMAGIASQPAKPYREILFLPERNLRMELYTGVKLDANTPNAAGLAGVDEVRQIKDLPAELIAMGVRGPFVLEPGDAKARAALSVVGAALNSTAPPPLVEDLDQRTPALRAHKSAAEIELLKKAAAASVDAQRAMMQATHDGQRERTLDGVLDHHFKQGGCERPAYPSIVGSGVHSTELHYMDNSDTLHAGDVMVVDAACEYSMYAMDITRTMPVNGHFTARQREIYDIVLGAQKAAIDSFVSGKTNMRPRTTNDANSLDFVAFQYIDTHGKDLHGEPLGKYFIHGVGHGVGINVHDPGDGKPFGPGSVFTIEPGIYIPEEKIGVRIEDTFYVDESGKLQCLSCALPKSAQEVETIVQSGTGEPMKTTRRR